MHATHKAQRVSILMNIGIVLSQGMFGVMVYFQTCRTAISRLNTSLVVVGAGAKQYDLTAKINEIKKQKNIFDEVLRSKFCRPFLIKHMEMEFNKENIEFWLE